MSKEIFLFNRIEQIKTNKCFVNCSYERLQFFQIRSQPARQIKI